MKVNHVFDEIVDFIAGHHPERVIHFHPSEETQKRVELLLAKKHDNQLTESEKSELNYFLMLEHIIRLAKARALKQLAA
jgi:hypothetical protein